MSNQEAHSLPAPRPSSHPTYFGLTGGIASGKTTVAGMMEALGARVIDADRIGHMLLLPGTPSHRQVVVAFGNDFLDSSGQIDRQRLGAVVFDDRAMLRRLNAIVHPQIIARVEELAEQHRAQDPQAVIIVDAALIFEAGIGGRFAKVIVVWCRAEQQVERLMSKARLSRQEAERRIALQMPVEEKRLRADYQIGCTGTLEETRSQVESLYVELARLAANPSAI